MFSSGPALMEIKRLKDRLETLKKEVVHNFLTERVIMWGKMDDIEFN